MHGWGGPEEQGLSTAKIECSLPLLRRAVIVGLASLFCRNCHHDGCRHYEAALIQRLRLGGPLRRRRWGCFLTTRLFGFGLLFLRLRFFPNVVKA